MKSFMIRILHYMNEVVKINLIHNISSLKPLPTSGFNDLNSIYGSG